MWFVNLNLDNITQRNLIWNNLLQNQYLPIILVLFYLTTLSRCPNNQSLVLARYAAIINFASVAALVLLALGSTQGCVGEKEASVEPAAKETNLAEVAILSDLIKSEDLILDLTPQLSRISAWYELRSQDPSLPLPPELSTCVRAVLRISISFGAGLKK